MNDSSSRSHLIMLCDLKTAARGGGYTRLCLVDLAGKLSLVLYTQYALHFLYEDRCSAAC